MKSKHPNTHLITFTEKLRCGTLKEKSFACPKNLLEFHMKELAKSPECIYNPSYRNL